LEGLVKGDVVVALFPFSDFTQLKQRPALVLAVLTGNDLILCEITSRRARNHYAMTVINSDFTTGSLREDSNIRPEKIITIERRLIRYKVGSLKPEKIEEVIRKIVEIIEQ
jgi:mRNA interferase MazF